MASHDTAADEFPTGLKVTAANAGGLANVDVDRGFSSAPKKSPHTAPTPKKYVVLGVRLCGDSDREAPLSDEDEKRVPVMFDTVEATTV